jgi:hypothetical protein
MAKIVPLRSAGAALLLLGALAGVLAGLYAYFTPLTGVTGTLGARWAIVAAAAIALMAVPLARLGPGAGRIAWRIALLILLVGNGLAGALLHEWGLLGAMAAGLAGLALETLRPAGRAGKQDHGYA